MGDQDLNTIVKNAAKKHGVPEEFMHSIFQHESGGGKFLTSHDASGQPVAHGIMQITPDTARSYGVDPKDLYDPNINADLSARIIKSHMDKFKGDDGQPNYHAVAAAYHAGAGAVNPDGSPIKAKGYGKKTKRYADDVYGDYLTKSVSKLLDAPVSNDGNSGTIAESPTTVAPNTTVASDNTETDGSDNNEQDNDLLNRVSALLNTPTKGAASTSRMSAKDVTNTLAKTGKVSAGKVAPYKPIYAKDRATLDEMGARYGISPQEADAYIKIHGNHPLDMKDIIDPNTKTQATIGKPFDGEAPNYYMPQGVMNVISPRIKNIRAASAGNGAEREKAYDQMARNAGIDDQTIKAYRQKFGRSPGADGTSMANDAKGNPVVSMSLAQQEKIKRFQAEQAAKNPGPAVADNRGSLTDLALGGVIGGGVLSALRGKDSPLTVQDPTTRANLNVVTNDLLNAPLHGYTPAALMGINPEDDPNLDPNSNSLLAARALGKGGGAALDYLTTKNVVGGVGGALNAAKGTGLAAKAAKALGSTLTAGTEGTALQKAAGQGVIQGTLAGVTNPNRPGAESLPLTDNLTARATNAAKGFVGGFAGGGLGSRFSGAANSGLGKYLGGVAGQGIGQSIPTVASDAYNDNLGWNTAGEIGANTAQGLAFELGQGLPSTKPELPAPNRGPTNNGEVNAYRGVGVRSAPDAGIVPPGAKFVPPGGVDPLADVKPGPVQPRGINSFKGTEAAPGQYFRSVDDGSLMPVRGMIEGTPVDFRRASLGYAEPDNLTDTAKLSPTNPLRPTDPPSPLMRGLNGVNPVQPPSTYEGISGNLNTDPRLNNNYFDSGNLELPETADLTKTAPFKYPQDYNTNPLKTAPLTNSGDLLPHPAIYNGALDGFSAGLPPSNNLSLGYDTLTGGLPSGLRTLQFPKTQIYTDRFPATEPIANTAPIEGQNSGPLPETQDLSLPPTKPVLGYDTIREPLIDQIHRMAFGGNDKPITPPEKTVSSYNTNPFTPAEEIANLQKQNEPRRTLNFGGLTKGLGSFEKPVLNTNDLRDRPFKGKVTPMNKLPEYSQTERMVSAPNNGGDTAFDPNAPSVPAFDPQVEGNARGQKVPSDPQQLAVFKKNQDQYLDDLNNDPNFSLAKLQKTVYPGKLPSADELMRRAVERQIQRHGRGIDYQTKPMDQPKVPSVDQLLQNKLPSVPGSVDNPTKATGLQVPPVVDNGTKGTDIQAVPPVDNPTKATGLQVPPASPVVKASSSDGNTAPDMAPVEPAPVEPPPVEPPTPIKTTENAAGGQTNKMPQVDNALGLNAEAQVRAKLKGLDPASQQQVLKDLRENNIGLFEFRKIIENRNDPNQLARLPESVRGIVSSVPKLSDLGTSSADVRAGLEEFPAQAARYDEAIQEQGGQEPDPGQGEQGNARNLFRQQAIYKGSPEPSRFDMEGQPIPGREQATDKERRRTVTPGDIAPGAKAKAESLPGMKDNLDLVAKNVAAKYPNVEDFIKASSSAGLDEGTKSRMEGLLKLVQGNKPGAARVFSEPSLRSIHKHGQGLLAKDPGYQPTSVENLPLKNAGSITSEFTGNRAPSETPLDVAQGGFAEKTRARLVELKTQSDQALAEFKKAFKPNPNQIHGNLPFNDLTNAAVKLARINAERAALNLGLGIHSLGNKAIDHYQEFSKLMSQNFDAVDMHRIRKMIPDMYKQAMTKLSPSTSNKLPNDLPLPETKGEPLLRNVSQLMKAGLLLDPAGGLTHGVAGVTFNLGKTAIEDTVKGGADKFLSQFQLKPSPNAKAERTAIAPGLGDILRYSTEGVAKGIETGKNKFLRKNLTPEQAEEMKKHDYYAGSGAINKGISKIVNTVGGFRAGLHEPARAIGEMAGLDNAIRVDAANYGIPEAQIRQAVEDYKAGKPLAPRAKEAVDRILQTSKQSGNEASLLEDNKFSKAISKKRSELWQGGLGSQAAAFASDRILPFTAVHSNFIKAGYERTAKPLFEIPKLAIAGIKQGGFTPEQQGKLADNIGKATYGAVLGTAGAAAGLAGISNLTTGYNPINDKNKQERELNRVANRDPGTTRIDSIPGVPTGMRVSNLLMGPGRIPFEVGNAAQHEYNTPGTTEEKLGRFGNRLVDIALEHPLTQGIKDTAWTLFGEGGKTQKAVDVATSVIPPIVTKNVALGRYITGQGPTYEKRPTRASKDVVGALKDSLADKTGIGSENVPDRITALGDRNEKSIFQGVDFLRSKIERTDPETQGAVREAERLGIGFNDIQRKPGESIADFNERGKIGGGLAKKNITELINSSDYKQPSTVLNKVQNLPGIKGMTDEQFNIKTFKTAEKAGHNLEYKPAVKTTWDTIKSNITKPETEAERKKKLFVGGILLRGK